MSLTLRLPLSRTAAITAGLAREGAVDVVLEDEDVASLTATEREVLLALVRGDVTYRGGCVPSEWVEGTVAEVLAACRAEVPAADARDAERARQEAEDDARQEARQAEDAARWEAAARVAAAWAASPLEWRVDVEAVATCRPMSSTEDYRGPLWRAGYEVVSHKDIQWLEPIAYAEAVAETQRRRALRVAAERAAADAAKAETFAWIAEHGSPRLRRCVAEKLPFDDYAAVYRDERLAAERPGWVWERAVGGDAGDIRNPTEAAFALLDRARVSVPDAKLVAWSVDCDCGDGEHDDDYADHEKVAVSSAAMATFLGRDIVFFG